MKLGDAGCAIGRGLIAGLCGAAAMTLSSTIEMKLRGRQPSAAPADAALKVLRLQPTDNRAKARFSDLVHWSYGTGWGLARAALDLAGCESSCAIPTHFAAVWGSSLVMLPALDVAPPVTKWSAEDVAIDAFHHTVYVVAVDLAYTLLKGCRAHS